MNAHAALSHRHSSPWTVAIASLVGTSIEWYDFYIFGGAAALVFPTLYFPFTGEAGVLAAFAVFWVGFLGRPLGGALFGHYGDRFGRRNLLILAIVMMGCGTVAVGLLPTYEAIGMWAPALLIGLRFVQGVAVGGEWAGAVLMATEHAPTGNRGFYGSFPQMGSPIGAILSSGVAAVVAAHFSSDGRLTPSFYEIGWRIPFLASSALVIIGLIIRLSVSESPVFETLRANAQLVKAPVRLALQTQWKTMLLAGGTIFAVNVGYLYGTQIISYASGPTSLLHVPAAQTSTAVTIGGIAFLVATFLGGALSDRFGRRTMAMIGAGLLVVLAFPIYWMIDTKQFALFVLAECAGYTTCGLVSGPLAALFAESFRGNVRYSAASVAYHSAAMIGGMAPFLGSALLKLSHMQSWVLSLYLIVTGCISFESLYFIKERRNVDMAA